MYNCRMNIIVGVFLLVLTSVLSGAALGGLAGLLLTGINNFILVPYFNAASGTYQWWIVSLAQLGSIVFGLISLVCGAFLAYSGK